jgi:hypothetical protein
MNTKNSNINGNINGNIELVSVKKNINSKSSNINGNIELVSVEKNINSKSSYLKKLPNPVFLVFGISKNTEHNKLRSIYNNPSYYFLDIQNPKKESIIEEGRFIHCDFNNIKELMIIIEYFKEVFNIIFFDTGVIMHLKFESRAIIIQKLLYMVKKNGYIIIPELPFRPYKPNTMTQREYIFLIKNNRNKLIKKQEKNFHSFILESFKDQGMKIIPFNYKKIKSNFSNVYNTNWPSKYAFIIYKNS